jgi:acetyl esterase/lipase
MSAVLAHFARDEGISLKLQLLVVPAIDMRYCPIEGDINPDTCQYKSVVDLADMPWGPAKREQWFLNYFIGKDTLKREIILSDWRMTPVLAPSFSGLAPAHIVTAEFDVERDEGEYYGELLRRAGNKVTAKRYLGVPHAFAHYNHSERGLSKSREYIQDTAAVLKAAHDLPVDTKSLS